MKIKCFGKRALVVILTISIISQGIIPAYAADRPDKHSESENIVSEEISEESIIPDEVVLASPDNAAYDSGKNEDITIEEVYEEDPLSADGVILGTPINEGDDRLIIGSEGTVLRVPDNPKDIELVYSLEDDTYIGSTYSTEIDNEYSDKSIFVQLTLTPLDPQQIAFGSREQKVKIPLSDMLVLDDRIYFSIEASNEMKLTNSGVKDNWEVELSLLISDDENTELEDLTDGEMFHREGCAQSGDDAFAFADSVLFTVENIKQTSFDPYSLLVVMAPQDTWWKSENYQRSDIDEIIFGQTPTADIKETWNADADNYGFIKCFITETIGDDRSYRTVYIARTVGNSSRIMANPDSESMFNSFSGDSFSHLTKIDINDLDTSNVTNMQSMFDECEGLEELDLSGFDTGSVTNMSCMFRGCNSLEELDLSGFDTSSVTYMGNLISGCSSLKEIDLSSFNTGNTIIMEGMFEGCEKLTELDLSRFKTDNVTRMFDMFKGCERLTTIFAYEFDTDNVPSIYNYDSEMFAGCISLTGEKGTKYDANHVGKEYAHIDGGADAPGYFTSKESEQEESVKYTVTFDSNGHGTAPAQQQIAEGEKIEKPDDLVSEGYTFEGWYKEVSCENEWNFNTDVVNCNITLYAKWIETSCVVTFDSNGNGFAPTSQYVRVGMKVIEPSTMFAEGFDFVGWYKEPNCENEWNFATDVVNGNLTLYAKWTRNSVVAGGVIGSCKWSVYSEDVNTMIIEPQNGNEGILDDWSYGCFGAPWPGDNIENVIVKGKVTALTCANMFNGFSSLKKIDLKGLDTSNVTDMNSMFCFCENLTYDEIRETLSALDTSNVTDMNSMFGGCLGITDFDMGFLDTSMVRNMQSLFAKCENLKSVNLSNSDTGNVMSMASMFNGCSCLEEVNLSNLDTSKVSDMSLMFCDCGKLEELDFSNIDTGNVTNMNGMFGNCEKLKELDLCNFDTRNVTNMNSMFSGCCDLTRIDLSSFDTSKVTDMSSMFKNCDKLETIDVSSFNTHNVVGFFHMFASCASLTTIYASHNFTTANCILSAPGIFAETAPIGGKGTKKSDLNIQCDEFGLPYCDAEFARIDEGPVKPGLFTDINAIEDSGLKIIKFISPSGDYVVRTKYDLKCYAFEVEPSISELGIDLEVTEGADWKLYSDSACKNELNKNDKVSLSDEINYFYVKVYNDSENTVYAIELNKDLSNKIKVTSVSYKSFFAEDKDKDIKIDIQWGWDLFKNPLDHNADRRTMMAALMLANGAYNDIEQVYKELGFKEINRRQRAIDVGEYSYALREVNFDGNKKLILSLTFRGTQNPLLDGLWDIEAATGFLEAGFETGAISAVNDMLNYYRSYLKLYETEDILFFITGHSLGGAEANEAAMLLAKEYNSENIFAYTFSSPTTTDKSDYSVPKLFNLYNTEDIVPKAGENYGIIQKISNGQWHGKRYGHDLPFTRESFMEDEFRTITGGLGYNDIISISSTNFFECMLNTIAYPYNKIMLEHQPDTLLAYLLSFEKVIVEPSQPSVIWRRISVKCPVDIEVIDSDGISVAKIVDNQIKELKDPSLILFVHDDEKYILSLEKKDYKLKLIGTDNGEMELAVDEIDFSTGEERTKKQFNHVALYDGKEMLGTVNEEAEQSALHLMENGKPIKNIETNGTETPISTTYTVLFNSNGHGTSPSSQQISAGEKVSKPADSTASGYTFGGWYKESSCVNKWNFDTDVVNGNMTLYAKWTSKDSGYSGNYSSGSSGGSGGGGGSVSKPKTTTGATYSPNWFVDASGVWKIRNSKGELVKNAWLCDDVITANGQNVWYLLQADGSMLSAGLVQDNTGNFYSLETTHNGYFGMMRYKDGYYDCNGQQVYLKFNQKHDNSFGAVINEDGLEKLKQIYGITKYPIGNETCTYTASF